MQHAHPALTHYANAFHHTENGRHDIAAREIDAALALACNDYAFDNTEGDRLIAEMQDLAGRVNREAFYTA